MGICFNTKATQGQLIQSIFKAMFKFMVLEMT